MSRKFQTMFLLALAALFAATVSAEQSGAQWRVNLLKGTTTIDTLTGATADEAWQKCRDAIPQSATVSTSYRCQTLVYAVTVNPDPVCDPPPASTTRTQSCPAGTVGSWEQTSTSTVGPLPECIVTTTWSPSEAPAGACVVPNSPPTIGGTPLAAIEAGQPYSFTPTAADADGDTLGFTIENRPQWASFDPATGTLSGTPALADVGISSSIKITVSDGEASASTSAFSITVTQPPPPPSSAWTTADVGAVAAAGSTSVDANGVLTLKGSGADIWASADEFHFAYRQLSGDGELIARVTSLSNQNQWTKVGLMVRESTAAGSRHATMFLASTRGDAFQYRVNNGGTSGGDAGDNVLTRPRWLKITRAGDVLRGFWSADGVSWTQRGTITLTGLPANVLIGVALTSHLDGTLATATLDSIGGGGTNPPPTDPPPTDPPPTGTGQAVVSWTPPTQNTDGSALTNLAGYRVLYGQSSSALNQSIEISNASMTSYTVTGLAVGAWYFAVTARSTSGAESAQSSVATKTIQ